MINTVISIQEFIPPLTVGPLKSREKLILTSKGLDRPCYTVWSKDAQQRPVSAPLASEPCCEAFFYRQHGEGSLRQGGFRHTKKARSKHCCPPGQGCLFLSSAHGLRRGKPPAPPESFSAAISSTRCSCLACPQQQQEQDAASLRSHSLLADGYIGGKQPYIRLQGEVQESEQIPL